MGMIPAELIKKTRNGQPLSAGEIEYLINAYTESQLPDYQMAAWAMAVFFKGLTNAETAELTRAMKDSGHSLATPTPPPYRIDKHSTGGVGDKTSLILAPIAAAAGVQVPMIAGRGLGHTGGTLDKLESIPGFSIQPDLKLFEKMVQDYGIAIIGQTKDICPADQKLYALRDVTGTVESLPLICASIMSKKLAEGLHGLVLDVKCGSGAFMKTPDTAKQLAEHLVSIGRSNGLQMAALISDMNQPLGRYVGNSLEVQEALDILSNEPVTTKPNSLYHPTRELSLELAAYMIWFAHQAASLTDARLIAEEMLVSGKARKIFEELIRLQGGELSRLPEASQKKVVVAPESGYLFEVENEAVGLASIQLGAGRLKKEDTIVPTAGIECHWRLGEAIEKGQPLFTLYAEDSQLFAAAEERLLKAIKIQDHMPSLKPLIMTRIEAHDFMA